MSMRELCEKSEISELIVRMLPISCKLMETGVLALAIGGHTHRPRSDIPACCRTFEKSLLNKNGAYLCNFI